MPALLKKFLSVLGESPKNRYVQWLSQFSSSLKQRVCTRDFLREAGEEKSEQIILDFYDNSDAIDSIDAMLNVDVKTYLPGDLLVKVDRATMAYGLEARSPFLDQNIMEFCKAFNAETEKMEGILPCVVTVYEDRSFSFEIKTPPASYLIKKAANIEKGSSTTPMVKVGTISESQLEEIAKVKMKDLNANDVSSAKKIVEGTAKSMGIEISN